MRALFNRWRRWLVNALLYRRVFGERSQGRWLPHTRISPASHLEQDEHLVLADHVYIGPFCWLEASAGITLEEGVQITSHVSIVTHSSHRSQRLLGRTYAAAEAGLPVPGWVAGPVHIGAYSFIGPQVVIEAGTRVGRGCIVRAGSVLRGTYPDHAVIDGRPAVVVGDARLRDELLLAQHPECREAYAEWAAREESPAASAGLARCGTEPPP